ncbi:MAG TPA: NAD(+)/NADH kinase, partial [Candidatus Dormibacteraeota bacterium]|nr:NAD(+)/NADH kinase [Candidatus Dormibacteraeota bacterium]
MKRSVAFVFHPRVARDLPEVAAARELLATRGIECWDVSREIAKRRLPAQLRRTGLIVTLGGDGTFLAGARLAAPRGIDVLGVNLGRLGFLTELEPGGLVGGLERYLNGEMRIEERSVLEVVLRRESKVVMRALAVN